MAGCEKSIFKNTDRGCITAGIDRKAASAPVGDRPDGTPMLGADDASISESRRGNGRIEIDRSAAMGRFDERLQGAGGRSHNKRVNI